MESRYLRLCWAQTRGKCNPVAPPFTWYPLLMSRQDSLQTLVIFPPHCTQLPTSGANSNLPALTKAHNLQSLLLNQTNSSMIPSSAGKQREINPLPRHTSDVIPSSTRGTHGSHKQNIHNVQPVCVFLVKPVAVVNPLSQQLNGGLGSIHLFGWHVKVICRKKPQSHTL